MHIDQIILIKETIKQREIKIRREENGKEETG